MFGFLLSLFVIATGTIDVGLNPVDLEGGFGKTLNRAIYRMEAMAPRRPFRFTAMNDSLEKMAAAVRGMQTNQPDGAVWELLEASRKAYPENSFSLLLQGLMLDYQGRQDEANQVLENFLLNSRTFSEFEEKFLKWGEFHSIRRYVYELLLVRGVTFEGREQDIQVQVPFREFFEYAMSPDRPDVIYNIFFVVIILVGAVGLIIAQLMEVDFSQPVVRNLPGLYGIVWLSYALWIVDLAFGLPFGWNRMIVIPILLGGSLGYAVVLEALSYYQARNQPLEQGFKRCPYCKDVVVQLAVQCSHCRKSI